MSNCIQFVAGELEVKTTPLFWYTQNRVQHLSQAPDSRDWIGCTFWWFVPRHLEPAQIVRWQPGEGTRSSHTWRDFKSLVNALHTLLCSIAGHFRVTDECDNFKNETTFTAQDILDELYESAPGSR